jgi:hypothetical protein
MNRLTLGVPLLSPSLAVAHVGDHHAMDFFHGFSHFLSEHYPFILSPLAIAIIFWIARKSLTANR